MPSKRPSSSAKTRSPKGDARRLPTEPPRDVDELNRYLASFTNYEQQKSLPKDRRNLGPQRAAHLLERLGLLDIGAPVIQVAGSKGKGSTVLWMESLLRLRGHRPGCYMSPHLQRLNERIRIDGEEVPDEIIVAALGHLHSAIAEIEAKSPDLMPTFFDLWTCLALFLFREAKVTHILLEVGLGGPLDSTSAIPHQVGVLTSVDLEHRNELGPDLESIAKEKARIARRHRPFIIADIGETWGREAAIQARKQGADICAAPIDLRIPTVVEAPQDRNLAVALATLEALDGFPAFSAQEVETAVQATRLAGRLEELTGPPPLLLDSAHTAKSMAYFQRRFVGWRGARQGAVLIGFLDGKEWEQALAIFESDGASIDWIVTTPEPKRRLDPRPIAEQLRRYGGDVVLEEDVPAAIALLRRRAKQGCALGVTGSFYLAGQVRNCWNELPVD
ncbi:MAG: hypothetical protein KDC38_09380 [Planctomycetes bacterium]|nr:hypothetical protein [Planctomycetota bacterium]